MGRGEQAGSPVFEDLVCFHLYDQGLALRRERNPYLREEVREEGNPC